VRTVPPGRYPVWLALARKASDAPWAERVACTVLQLSDGVDSGNTCFVDAAAVAGLDPALRRALYADGVVGA
jgi:hypothetical protein